VPGVQLGLQAVALGQQGAVLGRQLVRHALEAGPEGVRRDAGAGQHLGVDEAGQVGIDLQAVEGVRGMAGSGKNRCANLAAAWPGFAAGHAIHL
jgi:tetrahydromethanopterin S-methyltransferase subunit C